MNPAIPRMYAVHQPMFFPPVHLVARWLYAGRLIILNTDQSKKDGFHTRCRLWGPGGMVTVPVPLKDRSFAPVSDVKVSDYPFFKKKFLKTLQALYGRAPRYKEVSGAVASVMEELEDERFEGLARASWWLVQDLAGLGIPTYCASMLGSLSERDASDRLAKIGQRLGADTYLCSMDAAQKYLRLAPFHEVGVRVLGFDFSYPSEPVGGRIWSDGYRSILDLVMWLDQSEIHEVLSTRVEAHPLLEGASL